MLVLCLAIASFFLSLVAPCCWYVADRELRGIAEGQIAWTHRGWLRLGKGIGIVITCLAGAMFLIGIMLAASAGGAAPPS